MRIEAHLLPEQDRMAALPRHFGRHMLTVERRIFDFMSRFASKWSGGCWSFFELSHGGFYMSPPDAEDVLTNADAVRLGRVKGEVQK